MQLWTVNEGSCKRGRDDEDVCLALMNNCQTILLDYFLSIKPQTYARLDLTTH
jgi:hypothetical protein